MGTVVILWLAAASLMALAGTNVQARLSRQRLLGDADPLVAAAGRLWSPVRWFTRPSRKRLRTGAEAKLRNDPARWQHYRRLCQELFAWNAIESSVALAAVASVVALVAQLLD
jgi:hypothetical protein